MISGRDGTHVVPSFILGKRRSEMDAQLTLPIFLGVSYRAQRRGIAWDLYGLSDFVPAPFFPQIFRDQAIVFAFPSHKDAKPRSGKLILRDESKPHIESFIDI